MSENTPNSADAAANEAPLITKADQIHVDRAKRTLEIFLARKENAGKRSEKQKGSSSTVSERAPPKSSTHVQLPNGETLTFAEQAEQDWEQLADILSEYLNAEPFETMTEELGRTILEFIRESETEESEHE